MIQFDYYLLFQSAASYARKEPLFYPIFALLLSYLYCLYCSAHVPVYNT